MSLRSRISSCYLILPLTARDYCFGFRFLVNFSGKVTLSSWGGNVKYCATVAIWWLKLELACYSKRDVLGIYVFNNSFSLSCPSMPNFCRNSLVSPPIFNYLRKGRYFQRSPDVKWPCCFLFQSYSTFSSLYLENGSYLQT